MSKFKKYIKKGVNESLENVPFHQKAPVKRLLMSNSKSMPGSDVSISIHLIKDLPSKIPDYGELHKHDCNEINLIISENSKLVYQVTFEDEVYKVSSPSTVFIPKGVRHKAKVISGEGTFVCVIFQGKYKAKK